MATNGRSQAVSAATGASDPESNKRIRFWPEVQSAITLWINRSEAIMAAVCGHGSQNTVRRGRSSRSRIGSVLTARFD